VKETGTSDLPENGVGIGRETLSPLGSLLPVERPTGFEVIGTIQHASHHVPLGETQRMVAYGIENPPVVLALGACASGTGWTMTELRWTRCIGGPAVQLLDRSISQRVVQPHGP
jgi:hypothetical protein